MKLQAPELIDRLAAEYVLGSMRGAARRRFADHARRNPAIQTAISRWEAHLTPLASRVPAIDPPTRVWQRIEARLDARASKATPTSVGSQGFWSSLAFWRNWGLAATLACALLSLGIALRQPAAVDPMLTAVLAEDDQIARVLVAQPKSNMLNVKMVKPWKTMNGMALELWVIPKDGAPRSLGVIKDDGETAIVLVGLDGKLANGMMFAISKEPPGGSPTGAPTGQVMCKGAIARMPPKPNGQI